MDGQGNRRQNYGDGDEAEGGVVVAGLEVGEDGEGEGLGEAGDVARHDDGGAEFAQAAGEAEEGRRRHAAIGQREGDGKQGADGAGAQAAGGFFEAGIDAARATSMARTIRGRETSPAARAAAIHVKRRSIPKAQLRKRPTIPSLERSSNRA